MPFIDPDYAELFVRALDQPPVTTPHIIGNPDLLCKGQIAIFASVGCPRSIRDSIEPGIGTLARESIVIIGGFHAPAERACLPILLKGCCQVVIWLTGTLSQEPIVTLFQDAIQAGRLTLIAPFSPEDELHYSPQERANRRNQLVAATAESLLILYAKQGGKIDRLCQRAMMEWVKPVYALNHPDNQRLIERARAWSW
jgi:predicted Rossmann fold nucleotide-binding protein DprA/Smf involved in DNA uptake